MYKAFLIKYGEIGVKGKNRYLFEDALVRQIRYALKEVDGEFNVTKENGRIYATAVSDFDYDEAVAALKRVFGIIGICPVVQIEDNGFDDLAKHVVEYFDATYPDKNITFKVNARRARKNYPMDSMEINMELGGRLLDAFPELKVDVHKPEVLLQVEIRNKINIYSVEIPGPGGMPIGTAGKAMLLLSSKSVILILISSYIPYSFSVRSSFSVISSLVASQDTKAVALPAAVPSSSAFS